MIGRALDLITSLFFVAILFLPLLTLNKAPWSNPQENRSSAFMPPSPTNKAALLAWPAKFEAFFNDHFGCRSELIAVRRSIDFWAFRRSPTPDVLIGSSNWLFFTGDQSIEDYVGDNAVSNYLLAKWGDELQRRHEWMKAHGIAYFFVVTPNKQTIYPEFMPTALVRGRLSRRERIIGALDASGRSALLYDLTPSIAAIKRNSTQVLYHPLDSHWNDLGAYWGYHYLAGDIRKMGASLIHPLDIPIRDFPKLFSRWGDLASMMGFSHGYPFQVEDIQYEGPALNCGKPVVADLALSMADTLEEKAFECDAAPAESRAVIFHDSMTFPMRPYFNSSFRRTYYVRSYPFFTDLVAYALAEHPGVVIEQRNERGLLSALTSAPKASVVFDNAMPPPRRDGVVDLTQTRVFFNVTGFSFWNTDDSRARLHVRTNFAVKVSTLEAYDSPDVSDSMHDKRLRRARFNLRLFLDQTALQPRTPSVCLWTEDPTFGAFRPYLNSHNEWNGCDKRLR